MPQTERFYDLQKNQRIDLERGLTITIGRGGLCAYVVDFENEVTLESGARVIAGRLVSRNHATLKYENEGEVALWDNKSRYGTFLERYLRETNSYSKKEEIHGRTVINRGDIITLGPAYAIKYLTKREKELDEQAQETGRISDTWVEP